MEARMTVGDALDRGLRSRLQQMRPDAAGRRSLRGYSREYPEHRYCLESTGQGEPAVTRFAANGGSRSEVSTLPDDILWL
jgi:hypothetical protein